VVTHCPDRMPPPSDTGSLSDTPDIGCHPTMAGTSPLGMGCTRNSYPLRSDGSGEGETTVARETVTATAQVETEIETERESHALPDRQPGAHGRHSYDPGSEYVPATQGTHIQYPPGFGRVD
jgi:hypothetical protein